MKEGVNVSKLMSSERIQRLNALLKVLRDNPFVAREDLMNQCGYVSERTLESDIRFMRHSFGAKIRYSRSMKGYILEGTGDFILWQ